MACGTLRDGGCPSRCSQRKWCEAAQRRVAVRRCASLEVRTIVFTLGAAACAKVPATRFASSPERARDHQVALRDAGGGELAPAHRARRDGRHVVALRQRLEPARLEIDDRQVMVGVQRLNDLGADKARTDHEDPHLCASVLRVPPLPSTEAEAVLVGVTFDLLEARQAAGAQPPPLQHAGDDHGAGPGKEG